MVWLYIEDKNIHVLVDERNIPIAIIYKIKKLYVCIFLCFPFNGNTATSLVEVKKAVQEKVSQYYKTEFGKQICYTSCTKYVEIITTTTHEIRVTSEGQVDITSRRTGEIKSYSTTDLLLDGGFRFYIRKKRNEQFWLVYLDSTFKIDLGGTQYHKSLIEFVKTANGWIL